MAGKKPARSLAARLARLLGRAADQDHRLRRRLRRDAHGAAAPLERLAGPRLAHHVDVFLEQLAALLAVDARHLELLLAVAETGDEADAAAADESTHGELLGEAHRIVQRHEDRRRC